MNANIYDLDGDETDSLELPEVFDTQYRPDLIERAVTAAQANAKQDYGADELAGLRTSAESPGSGRGMAHVPRTNGSAARVPQAVGGRRAHPPKAEKDQGKSINDKERQLAFRSAVAASVDADRVSERGHQFDDDLELPVVVDDDFEELVKTKDVVSLLEGLGAYADVERAEDGRTVRAGQGKRRGRKYQTPTSILFVSSSDAGPSRAARNLAGVDVATAANVDVEDLAPGTQPGRLTVWTASAVAEVNER